MTKPRKPNRRPRPSEALMRDAVKVLRDAGYPHVKLDINVDGSLTVEGSSESMVVENEKDSWSKRSDRAA